jgi:hypothetical protein
MNDVSTSALVSERPRDWFFVLAFLFFCYASFSSDAWHALGAMDDTTFWGRGNLWYARFAGDDFFLRDLACARLNTGISAFVFGPFYILLVYAFVRGRDWIRLPALIYVGAMMHGLVEFMVWEWVIGPPPRHPIGFWLFNGPFAIVPLLLLWRMWRPAPFSRPAR